jgi:hypothetical protein
MPARAVDVRIWMALYGAPLMVSEPMPDEMPAPALEVVVAEALALAHHDSTVARVLPVLLWISHERLDWSKLRKAVAARAERQALGFFLDLTGELADDSSLKARARRLANARPRRPRLFFSRPHGRYELEGGPGEHV